MSERVFQRVADVVQREVAGEVFLVPVRGELANLQELFALNAVGSWLWADLERPNSISELVASVVDEFEVSTDRAREDVESFIESLMQLGLVLEVEAQR